MEPLDALDAARAEFQQRLAALKPDQWEQPTPCTNWTVRDLVTHVVNGCGMTVALLDGASSEEAIGVVRSAPPIGDDVDEVMRRFVTAADAQDVAFRREGALTLTVHHPIGDIPGRQLLQFRTGDFTLHAWDLARGIGADEALDPELVALIYEGMAPMAPMIGQTGQFGTGPSGTLGDDAPVQARLLDLAGRRP